MTAVILGTKNCFTDVFCLECILFSYGPNV